MKNINSKLIMIAAIFLVWPFVILDAQWFLDFETGLALPGYNEVQIPGTTGTRFSLSEDLTLDSSAIFRLRCGYCFEDKHTLFIFAAPLSLDASGVIDRPINFNGEDFPANTPLNAVYTFNSYRFTYRYDFKRSENWRIGIGFTGKIRDAAIRLEGGNKATEKTNRGFVPLINFWIERKFNELFSIVCEGDALAAPQGRAEDVIVAFLYQVNKNFTIKGGYRILEGGADVEEVYNFALVNYIIVGTIITF